MKEGLYTMVRWKGELYLIENEVATILMPGENSFKDIAKKMQLQYESLIITTNESVYILAALMMLDVHSHAFYFNI